ncbi:nucleolar and coiled-body phosphoprotein 1-like [Sardina pilchardus]|uniref:nucleolar and coiled-body phosphoprotein 1-like n=1 Tax=Sardina pilchardus TaxID=27697 RepID=UPI002E143C59
MPVAVRRKSWEDHVSRRSVPRYSYDDLDLVCCHDGRKDGPRSRRGRRERCASMPECCQPGFATVATDDATARGQESETESAETPLPDVFGCGSVLDKDVVADQSRRSACLLAPPTAVGATAVDGASAESPPPAPTLPAKNPTASQTAAANDSLDPTNDNSSRSHGDDLEAAEAADSDCPAARHPNDPSDSEASLARPPDAPDAPRPPPPASAAQTTVAAGSGDPARQEDHGAAVAPGPAAAPTAREEGPSPLGRQAGGFEESAALKADLPARVPSVEFAAGESGRLHKPADAACQGHMTEQAEGCERPGSAQTDLGRAAAADIAGVDGAQEARGPEGLALPAASGVTGGSAAAAAAETQATQSSSGSSSSSSADRTERSPPPDCELLEALDDDDEELSATGARESVPPEPPVGSEHSGPADASQERRHEGGCAGSKLDTIPEVSFNETADETGAAERPGQSAPSPRAQTTRPLTEERRDSWG